MGGTAETDGAAPTIPVSLEQFTPAWAMDVMRKWFEKNEICPETVKICLVEPKLNSEQVTFIVCILELLELMVSEGCFSFILLLSQ